MMDKTYTRIILALALGLLAAASVTAIWGPPSEIKYRVGIFIPVGGILLIWLWMQFWLWLSMAPQEPLSDAKRRLYGRLLVGASTLVSTAALYRIAGIWHGAPAFAPQLFLRLYLFAAGLIWIIFGNFVPKLPYQPKRRWLEMGSARFHHLNRVGGWLLVGGGISVAIEAFVIPMNSALFLFVLFAITAAILLPYGALAVIYVRSYRREMRAEANA